MEHVQHVGAAATSGQGLSLSNLGHFVDSGFMPHGHCYLWQPALVWTHVISDLLIGFSYLAISLTLYFLIRRVRVHFSTVVLAFGAFIAACGATHFIEVWNLWNADYWLGGWVKVLTASASVATAGYLVRLQPQIMGVAASARLAESRREQLEELTRTLEQQVDERTRAFKAAERKFRTTFDCAAIGIAHVGVDGQWLMVNPRLCSITGYSKDELLEKSFSDITHPEDVKKDWELAQKLLNGEISTYELEKRYIRKDGQTIWIKLSVALSHDETGDPEYFISCVDDISALKATEREKEELLIREREARTQAEIEKQKLVSLFEQVPTPIAIYEGPEHIVTFANPAYREQSERENPIGQPYADVFPLLQDQGIVDLLTDVFKSGRPWNSSEHPVSFRLKDGRPTHRYLDVTLQPFKRASGEVAGLINLSYDVTEKVLARRELERSERRLNLALQVASMGVWEWNPSSGRVGWDARTTQLFCGPGSSFDGSLEAYTNRICPEDRDRVWSTIHQAVAGRKEFEVEHRVVWDDGSVHWVLCRGGVIGDERGSPDRVVGVVLDIGMRKEAEEAIRSREERFRAVFEQSPLSIEIHSPDGALQKVNKAWTRLWNIPETKVGEVIGVYNVLKDPQLKEKGIAPYIQQGFKGVFAKTPPTLYDPTEVGFEGRSRWVQTYISPVQNPDGSLREVVIIHEDITERRAAEEAIVAAKVSAETANAAKTQFLANMSHEIRTPLGAMLGFAQLMLEDEDSSESQKNSLRTIVRNGEQLYRIINELLDISKVEANKFEIEKSKFDLEEVIRDVTSLLSVKAEQKGVEFNATSEGPLPDMVFTDPVRFRQILMNVIGNALKFTEKGKVEVTFKLRDHAERDGSSCLEVKVEDTGIGIAPEKLEKLFRPFSQADQATSRKFGGTGLGLYLAKKFAQALGGDLKLLKCKENEGCTFLIVVDIGPLEKRPLMTFASQNGTHVVKGSFRASPLDRLHDVRVLVVDDSMDNLELTKRFLVAAGAQVETALGAKKAFERLEQEEFDVIVMDIQMPEIDGYEAVARLRKEGYEKPIIALTAHAMKGERERCLGAGFDGYLIKPINRPALVQEIRNQAGRGVEQ